MDKITKNLQFILLSIILISTVIAVGIEFKRMILEQSVNLADLLFMFLYLEVLAMVRVFWDQQSISITLPLLIAITALARFIILQGKEMNPSGLVYEAVAIVLIASAIACDVSNAGIIPSNFDISVNALTASSSLILTYSTLSCDFKNECSGPTPG